MKPFLKIIFAGWCILALTSIAAHAQGPVNPSEAYPSELAKPPVHASPIGGSPAFRLMTFDQPSFAVSGKPSWTPLSSAKKSHANKNGSDYFTGSGTAADPWLIATATDLDNVRHFVGEAHENKHFRQTANIDLGASPWNAGEGWVPIGNSIDPFHGHYDGNGYEILNLVIARDTSEYQGLFGRNNGTIINLGVIDANVTDNGSRAGILVGINNLGVIDNCHTSGIIQCNHPDGRIGGLTGWNSGTIRNSFSTATVTSTGNLVGGLTGANSSGTILNSSASGNVTGNESVGGLVGTNQGGGLINSSHASGEATGNLRVGGLTGVLLESTVENSHATGTVSGSNLIGGLAGSVTESIILNSHFSGNVEGATRVGGIAGQIITSSQISKSYSEGIINATGNWSGGLVGVTWGNAVISESYSTANITSTGNSAGGLSGTLENNSSIEDSHATGNVTGVNWVGGLAGTIITGSKASNSYSNAHVTGEGNYTGGICGTLESNSTIENVSFTGHVSGQTYTGGLVGWVGESVIINSFLTGNVEGEGWVGGVAGFFRGTTLTDSYSEGEVHARGEFSGGLVGSIFSESTVFGCYSTANVTSEGDYTGGLSGTLQSNSTIENSSFTGIVAGKTWTGGLVGWAGESFIINSFFSGNLEGGDRVGGIAGTLRGTTISTSYTKGHIKTSGNWSGGIAGVAVANSMVSESFASTDILSEGYTVGGLIGSIGSGSIIENAYSHGNLIGTNWVGGLVGWADSSSITNAYTANYMYAIQANVSGGLFNGTADNQITNAFWSVETTGEEESAGGEGKTNAEMTTQATFTGWDFDNIWAMQENETYPYLQWQESPNDTNYPASLYLLTLTASPEEAGTVSRQGMRPEGSLILISAATNEDYLFIEWTDAEGNTFGADSTKQFYMPGHDLALTATFHALINTISISAGDNGQVNPEGEVTVDYNQELVVTITPDTGYRIAYIKLNGVDIDLENDPGWDATSGTFTIANVVVNQHIEVGFELISFRLLFLVTDARTGAEIPDAAIRLEDTWYDAGIYLFDKMTPGTYNYLVTKDGYFEKGGVASISDDDLTEAVELDIDDTGLPTIHTNRLRVYPNPAHGEVRIDVGISHGANAVLRIYTLQGQTVYEKPVTLHADQTLRLSIGDLQPGIYLMALKTHDGVLVERLVIH